MIKTQLDQLRELRELYPSNLEDRHFALALELYAETIQVRSKLASSYKRTRAFLEDLCRLSASAEGVDSSWALQFVWRADDQVRGALATVDEFLETLKGRLDSWEDGDLEDVFRVAKKAAEFYALQAIEGALGAELLTKLVRELG